MKVQIIVHEAEEGGFWGEVPAIPGCVSQGESLDELERNMREAIEGCLSSTSDLAAEGMFRTLDLAS